MEFGDFQTPDHLAQRACKLLLRRGISPASIVEPTCGTGAFLRASELFFPNCGRVLGYEINPAYVKEARAGTVKALVRHQDFFSMNWPNALDVLDEPILAVGNPPWVTNSAIGAIKGTNLPAKTNFQRLRGFDAITGKSNFDISEWMLIHLLTALSGRSAVLAMLCKTVVARKVLRHAWVNNVQIDSSAIYSIDAARNFGAAVNACLFVCTLKPRGSSKLCDVFGDLESPRPISTFGMRDGRIVADLELFAAHGSLAGKSPLKWRSGIKHDCSRVMELRPAERTHTYLNGQGQVVELEPSFLFPMLKSSELTGGKAPLRHMLVTQRTIGEDTSVIAGKAPLTWRYLESHSAALDARVSSIYRTRPRFSIFGVGPYSFAPWKVAISGLYKTLDFRIVGPFQNKPVVLDDTCYFLPCGTEAEAEALARLLNSRLAQGYFRSFVFWDAKRPITSSLLGTLDLELLADRLRVSLPRWAS